MFSCIKVFRATPDKAFTYSDLLNEQDHIIREIKEGKKGSILLAEVSPVITLGRNLKNKEEFNQKKEWLEENGIELLNVDRGGNETYHGEGQWILFIVESLERLTGDSKGVRKATDLLLNIALNISKRYIDAEIRTGAEVGVWKKNTNEKAVSLGIQIKERILMHGICFNAFETSRSFLGLNPCGILGAAPCFLFNPEKPETHSLQFEQLKSEIIFEVKNNLKSS